MKLLNSIVLSALIISSNAIASTEFVTIGKTQGRGYHQDLYPNCKNCHDQGLKVQPSDTACQQCHDVEELVQITIRPDDTIKSHNPHNSMHYGTDVPCAECHGEHAYKSPLCVNCHNYKYPKHK